MNSKAPKILVVDDHPHSAELLAMLLEEYGYLVDMANEGEGAMQKVKASPPDLILLDVMMPGKNGFEVTQEIRNDPTLPFIPIILVTARTAPEDQQRGLSAGANGYLCKPVNLVALREQIAELLSTGSEELSAVAS